jgi:cell division septal protein FtsQ
LFWQGFQIENIIISGNTSIKTSEIKNLIIEKTTKKLFDIGGFKLISKSIFITDTPSVVKEVLQKFSSIEKLYLNRALPQTIVVQVIERKPIGVYCDSDGQCFLIDRSGVVFEESTDNIEGYFIVRQLADNKRVFVGESAISKTIMDYIYKIQKLIQEKFQINLVEALIAGPARINIKTSENWQIYFDSSVDISPQLIKLELLLTKEISLKQRNNLKYIDLRPKDRAIICDNDVCGKF